MDWRKAAATTAILAVVSYGVYYLFFRDGEDRPPIIVGDGSINIYADFDPNGNGRGEWDQASGTRWSHKNTGGAPTQRFDVLVFDGSGSAGCDDPDTPFDTTDLTVYFTGDVEKHFRIWIDPDIQPGQKKAIVDFTDGTTVTLFKKYWLKLPDASVDQRYRLTKVMMGSVNCNLGPDGFLKIYQRRN